MKLKLLKPALKKKRYSMNSGSDQIALVLWFSRKDTNVRALLKAINEQFATSDKALAITLIMKFSSPRLTNVKGVSEHIMEMRDIVAQLKILEIDMSNTFLVHYIFNTLLQQYGPFKISYNTHKEKWSINELLIMCVQDEGRLPMEQGKSAMLVTEAK